MRVGMRSLVAIASYAGVLALFWTIDFDEPGLSLAPHAPSSVQAAEGASASTEPSYSLSNPIPLSLTIGQVRNNYVDPARVRPMPMFLAGLESLERTVPEVFVRPIGPEDAPTAVVIRVGEAEKTFELGELPDLVEVHYQFKVILEFLDRELPANVARAEVEFAVANGMLETLDPHSVLLSPKVYRGMLESTSGKFGGLGIVISKRRGDLTVMSVLEGTPAHGGGIQRGDILRQINDESTVNMEIGEAVDLLRGDPGDAVTIWVERVGWDDPKPFTVTRDTIKIASVASKDLGKGVGYVHLKAFQENTAADMEAALIELEKAGSAKRGLVLDMRDNPGGLLDQAIAVSDLFMESGTIVATAGNNKGRVREEKKARRKGTRADLPIVVLVNSGSASASEIVTGALKNTDRAMVLGNQTFGKGSVQVLREIEDQNGEIAALKLTVARYLTPGDESIQSVGIAPDVLAYPVTLEPDQLDLYVSEKDLMGESELDNHLSSERDTERAEALASARLFRFYEAPDSARSGASTEGHTSGAHDADDEAELGTYEAVDDDYLTLFARDLLLAAGKSTRSETLRAAKKFFDRKSADEEKAVQARLRELGVDWPVGKELQAAPAGAQVELTIRTDHPGDRVTAGETLQFTAVATNVGTEAVGRLRGETVSDNAWFDNRELVFGTLEPGQSKEWSFHVELPKSAIQRRDPVRVRLYDDQTALTRAGQSEFGSKSIQIDALERPQLAYTWTLDDTKGGNGDGLLQRGEEVELDVRIYNSGVGPALELRANLKNESGRGVYLSQGRGRLRDGLAPGAAATLRYQFKVQDYLEGDAAELALVITDMELRETARHPFQVPLAAAEGAAATAGAAAPVVEGNAASWYAVGAGASLSAMPSSKAPTVALTRSSGALRVIGTKGEWLRVEGPDGIPAWMAASSSTGPVQMASIGTATAAPTAAVLEETWLGIPPRIELSPESVAALETDAETVAISGRAYFASDAPTPRDAYMFRDEEKVAYVPPNPNHATELPFEATVNLKPGANAISVFARQGADQIEYRRFYIHRTTR